MLLIGMCTSLTKKPTKPAFGVARVTAARRRRGSVVLVFDAARRTHDQEADHRRRRDACELLPVWLGALLNQVNGVLRVGCVGVAGCRGDGAAMRLATATVGVSQQCSFLTQRDAP